MNKNKKAIDIHLPFLTPSVAAKKGDTKSVNIKKYIIIIITIHTVNRPTTVKRNIARVSQLHLRRI